MSTPPDSCIPKSNYITENNHATSNYFELIKELVKKRNGYKSEEDKYLFWQNEIDNVYKLVADEIIHNNAPPVSDVKFGTSGWRGIIGKDLSLKSVSQVTLAIINLYEELETSQEHAAALGVRTLQEAQERGCVLGFDNRFGNELMARRAADVLTSKNFTVHYAGEATTGTLSAAVIELNAAFSINLTPSHNPLEYAGYKYNAADGGPAASTLTNKITSKSQEIIRSDKIENYSPKYHLIKNIDALNCWLSLVKKNISKHDLNYDLIIDNFFKNENFVLIIDSVHGASRIHVKQLFKNKLSQRLHFLRINSDPTFGGIAPEPSPSNLRLLNSHLNKHEYPLKLGVIMDPDADRIRFTDGKNEINMNQFGAMAYHFLHEIKKKKGMVAKTVATSNFANAIATSLGEEVFEPKVGFKEFKPVIGKALVCFEESDGITITGHTAEKDAYIGLLLAIDMINTLGMNLEDYLKELQTKYGTYYPDKDGITVSKMGQDLLNTLSLLDKYSEGDTLPVGDDEKRINTILNIDGHKMIFEDNSWLMIRPSGTEPKVRFYVEARSKDEKDALFTTAKNLLGEIGLL